MPGEDVSAVQRFHRHPRYQRSAVERLVDGVVAVVRDLLWYATLVAVVLWTAMAAIHVWVSAGLPTYVWVDRVR
jgi:hypothetical protein